MFTIRLSHVLGPDHFFLDRRLKHLNFQDFAQIRKKKQPKEMPDGAKNGVSIESL